MVQLIVLYFSDQNKCLCVLKTHTNKSDSEHDLFGPRQANLVFIAYASSEGSGEPAHPRSLARTFAARSYKQCQEEPSDRKPDPWPL